MHRVGCPSSIDNRRIQRIMVSIHLFEASPTPSLGKAPLKSGRSRCPLRQLVVCLFFFSFILVTIAPAQVQQKPLTNDNVIGMVSAGLSDDVIIAKIGSAQATDFDT